MTDGDLRVVESGPLSYVLSLPQSPDDGPRPVLCFLHGYDEAATRTELRAGMTRHGPLRPGSSPRATSDFIVVAPQLPEAGDLWRLHADAVREIVTGVQSAHGGDPARTYLTGFSFGGNGVFDLALLQPGSWTALWAVDPTRVPREDPRRPVWLSFGAVARHGKAAFIRALGLQPVAESAEGDRLYLDEGQDHVGSATLAYRDERIYRWLLSKRLPD